MRDEARFLAAGALLGLGRREGGAARALTSALDATPVARVVPRHSAGDRRVSAGLARALRTTALRRVPPEERAWVDRIEARRAELAAEHEVTEAVFSEKPDRKPSRWAQIVRPVPVSAACGVISIPPVWGLLLMRLVRELSPRSAIELGTGFGVSAAYLAAPLELHGSGSLATFEGAEKWATIAEQGASELGLTRLEVQVGALSDTLEAALPELAPVDLAFVDAEHTKEATLQYFAAMLPHLSDGAVVAFDDIAFDAPMWEAWMEIREHRRVAVALSLGRMGIVSVAGRASESARAR